MDKKLISCGSFAKLCNTSKKTLFHYDAKDILKPVAISESGYRYYSRDQVVLFSIIKSYQEAGMSLDEIKTMLQSNDTAEIDQLVDTQLKLIDMKIRELQITAEVIRQTRRNRQLLHEHPIGQLFRMTYTDTSAIMADYKSGQSYTNMRGSRTGGIFLLDDGDKSIPKDPTYLFKYKMFDDEATNGIIDGGEYICALIETVFVGNAIRDFIDLTEKEGIKIENRYLFFDISNDMIIEDKKNSILMVLSRIVKE